MFAILQPAFKLAISAPSASKTPLDAGNRDHFKQSRAHTTQMVSRCASGLRRGFHHTLIATRAERHAICVIAAARADDVISELASCPAPARATRGFAEGLYEDSRDRDRFCCWDHLRLSDKASGVMESWRGKIA